MQNFQGTVVKKSNKKIRMCCWFIEKQSVIKNFDKNKDGIYCLQPLLFNSPNSINCSKSLCNIQLPKNMIYFDNTSDHVLWKLAGSTSLDFICHHKCCILNSPCILVEINMIVFANLWKVRDDSVLLHRRQHVAAVV